MLTEEDLRGIKTDEEGAVANVDQRLYTAGLWGDEDDNDNEDGNNDGKARPSVSNKEQPGFAGGLC